MKSEWKVYSVQELIDLDMLEEPMDGNHGGIHPKSSDYVSSGVPFIMANNLSNGKVDYDNCAFISEQQATTLRKGFAHPGDVLLTHKATIGRTAIVGDEYDTIILTPQVTYYRVKHGISNRYLKYYFDSSEFQQTLSNWAGSGSTRAYLGITAQRKLPIVLPPMETQEKIAGLCGALDEKIYLNNAINNNLEQQADALYQSFFSPKSGTQGKLVTLDEYCSIFTGKKNANASVDGGKYKFFTCAPEALQIDSYIYDGNAIIVSGNGAYTGRTRFYSGKFDLYQRTYACTLLNNVNPEFIFPLYWFVKLELSKKIMGGTRGSAIPYIVMNDLAKFEFIYNEQTFTEYMPIFKSLTEAIQANEFENENLAQIRDSLLPKLMSGELDVSDIDF